MKEKIEDFCLDEVASFQQNKIHIKRMTMKNAPTILLEIPYFLPPKWKINMRANSGPNATE